MARQTLSRIDIDQSEIEVEEFLNKPLKEITSALTTKSVSANCCLYTQFCDGRANTLACFSLAITTNCRSLKLSHRDSPKVGLIRFWVRVGVPETSHRYSSTKYTLEKLCLLSRSLFSRLSSFHVSNVYGINAPLQSRKDNVRIPPFNRKIGIPTIETTTGWEERLSSSGGVIKMVNTEPKLVPTHSVGVNTEGSRNKFT